ncbi:MAG: hypothetical protein V3R77_05355, partial [Candidatus Binatia bacterium]
ALAMGLVNEVVPLTGLEAAVDSFCEDLLKASPGCLEILKAAFDQEMDGYAEMGIYSSQMYPDWFDAPEGKEGANAFTAQPRRRPAYWAIRKRDAEARQNRIEEYDDEQKDSK